jgi:hypothetical protein
MRILLAFAIMVVVAVEGAAFPNASLQGTASLRKTMELDGKWRVRFTFPEVPEKNMIFESHARGSGTFLFLDTEPDNKPVIAPIPAVWTQTTFDRVNFAGEVELPFGTCCRETGTLIFNGKFDAGNSISGKAIFITSTVDENLIGFRTMVGTFTAKRVTDGR